MAILATAFLTAVIGIVDGDTITVLHESEPVKIRLAEIDTPESSGIS